MIKVARFNFSTLLLSSVFTGSIWLSPMVLASDITAEHYDVSRAEFRISAVPSVILPFNNQLFLYGVDAANFDLADFLYVNAPALSDKQEVINHWAGYFSINPKIVLALMEMQSHIISNPSQKALNRPLGKLSKKHGFDAQLQDVLGQLSQRFYAYEEHELKGKKHVRTEAMNAATFALIDLLNSSKTGKAQRGQLQESEVLGLDQFVEQFGLLFNNTEAEILSVQLAEDEPIDVSKRMNTAPTVNAAASALPPSSLLQMPWLRGYSWISNGAHSHTGSGYPFSSIDVAYDWPVWGQPTYAVAAAHSGTVNVISRCQVRVTNANGWATNYYHMANVSVSSGQYVNQNTALGVYANTKNDALCEGGSSTGPHLHFSLLKDGRHVSLQGVNFGRYRINIGTYNYDNDCSRFNMFDLSTNRTVCAWTPLYNSGSI